MRNPTPADAGRPWIKQLAITTGLCASVGLSSNVYSDTIFEQQFQNGLGQFMAEGSVRSSSFSGTSMRGGSNPGSLVSQPIYVAGYSNLKLLVDHSSNRLDADESASILVSVDGGEFTEINASNSVSGTGTYALPEAAETVIVRFTLNASSYFESYSVNSVALTGTAGETPCDDAQTCCEDDCPPPPPGDGPLPEVDTLDADGPLTPVLQKSTGPDRGAWVGYPSELGANNAKHPIFIWGPGGGTGPEDYEFFLNRFASHGFVIFSLSASRGDGEDMVDAIDWLTSENNRPGSPYYQKLDLSKIAAGGHSMGSVTTFDMADDPRLTTTIHVAGGSFDGNGSDNLRKPALYIGGTEDFATPNAERDYENTDRVPVFFTILQGVDHIMAAREGMPIMNAWLRWHLGGETERRSDFIQQNCTYCSGLYDSQYKNW